jgi:hypothetical protein
LTPMNRCLYFSIHGEPRFYFFDCRS